MRNLEQMTVAAEEVAMGDFIPGLDNAYVVEVEEDADFRDRYNIGLAQDKITLTYNDAEGDEGYLILSRGTQVTVRRIG